MEYCTLNLPIDDYKSSFNLEKAVCNHGLFMMAPNLWLPSEKCLTRPLRLADCSTSVTVSITQPRERDSLHVKLNGVESISAEDKEAILSQVARMLRLSSKDEKDVQEFHRLHPEARERGFGRLFRSPTFFEDAVKCILLSNCQWQRSLEMAQSLCTLQLKLSNGLIPNFESKTGLKKKQVISESNEKDNNNIQSLGNFPTAKEVANLSGEMLNKYCNLGYRAALIINFSKRIQSGKIKLLEITSTGSGIENELLLHEEELFRKLTKEKGIGPFIATSIMMCIGFYQRLPIDSETRRHLKEVHGIQENETSGKRNRCKRNCSTKKQHSIDLFVKNYYGKYAPFQCLAFWMELINYYESKLGKLSELPHSQYRLVTGSVHQNS